MNLLFVCSRNQWRSPTAEAIYKKQAGINVRSAGTEPSARVKLTGKLIEWADVVFVMEKRHREKIDHKFRPEAEGKEIVILHIPDIYQFNDPELIDEIKTKVGIYLDGRTA